MPKTDSTSPCQKEKNACTIAALQLASVTLPSLNVDLDPGGYLEDLGLILGILAIMVSSI